MRIVKIFKTATDSGILTPEPEIISTFTGLEPVHREIIDVAPL